MDRQICMSSCNDAKQKLLNTNNKTPEVYGNTNEVARGQEKSQKGNAIM